MFYRTVLPRFFTIHWYYNPPVVLPKARTSYEEIYQFQTGCLKRLALHQLEDNRKTVAWTQQASVPEIKHYDVNLKGTFRIGENKLIYVNILMSQVIYMFLQPKLEYQISKSSG